MAERPLDGGILFFFHCGSNTGYAIAPLERMFFDVGRSLVNGIKHVHFAYPNIEGGRPEALPDSFKNVVRFDPNDGTAASLEWITSYVREHDIRWAVGFDQPVHRPVYRTMRGAGIRRIIAYWGAPMSSLNGGLKLFLKRIEVALHRHKPDHFIFESKAMAATATQGRGIRPDNVSVVYLGVDTERFRPGAGGYDYAYRAFGIPRERKIIFYSGHMQERKGVQVIVRAAVELVARRGRKDVHFLLVGNRDGEERRFAPIYAGTPAEDFVTFGGYRHDVPDLHRSSYAGVIASVGWDSFTMSAAEMASSGLPLVVSALQGLQETVDVGRTGYLVAPGSHEELCDRLARLLDNEEERDAMSVAAREMALVRFTAKRQAHDIAAVVRRVAGGGEERRA